jgi:O-antigen/teichoic acid export membrane protein
VLKFIGNVYMGMQLPAVSNLLIAIGQTFALIATWLLYITGHATFFNIVVVNTAGPLLAYLLAYPYTFHVRFPQLRPSLKSVNLHSALELGNLGLKFFWLQIAAILQFMTANILISRFFNPEMVTPYQIAYRYMSLVIVVFTVICMPFWNATTDAYERNDMEWIRQANKKMNWMTPGIALLLILMVIVSPWVYQIWIREACHVPLNMTAMMALYIFLIVASMRYSFFLNGIGVLQLQLYMSIMNVLFIPLAWIVSSYTQDIIWFMGVMCFCVAPGLVVNIIQFSKILKGNAKGIWIA